MCSSSLSKTQGLVDQATDMLNLILSIVVGTSNETLIILWKKNERR